MSRTITAMFNDRSEAEAAAAQLRSQIGTEARIIDQSSSTSESSSGSSGGFWSDLKDVFVADDDRAGYEEGVRRGHFLLSANVPEEQADRACNLIESAGAIDFDQSQEQWRNDGWSDGRTSQAQMQQFGDSGTSQRENIVEEERIPVVQEQLRVGKREVERGGTRVRSYVEERPVTEQVNLREEHVNVERRAVDQPISSADLGSEGLLQEREIEMRETSEQPVVSKEARVTEEVVVQKTANEHVEQVQDTVRNTNVEVDEARGDSNRGAFEFDDKRETSTSREFDNDTSGRR